MKSVTQLKGLADIRTALSTHARSTSRHKGTPYLEIMAFGMEKLRLDTQLALNRKQRQRIQKRLGEVNQAMGVRLGQVQGEGSSVSHSTGQLSDKKGHPEINQPRPKGLRTIALDY